MAWKPETTSWMVALSQLTVSRGSCCITAGEKTDGRATRDRVRSAGASAVATAGRATTTSAAGSTTCAATVRPTAGVATGGSADAISEPVDHATKA